MEVYHAYKTIKGVVKNPVVGIPYISMSDEDIVSLKLTDTETRTLSTLNSSGKGYLNLTFYENKATGQVYFSKNAIPAGVETIETPYTILNIFGCHSEIGSFSERYRW